MTTKQTVKSLKRLYRICVAGERGFNTVAENVRHRGLKLLLKTYAQQRHEMAEALAAEIKRLGGDPRSRRSLVGMIHRGRISIVAAMTIGRSNATKGAIAEAALGEDAALKAYQRTLAQDLPSETHKLVTKQYQLVERTHGQVHALKAWDGTQVAVRLLDQGEVGQLQMAGGEGETAVYQVPQQYQGEQSTVGEAVLSGAFGGSLWGSLIGAASAVAVLMIPGMDPIWAATIQGTSALVALSGASIGFLFGAFLGFMIGVGVSEESSHVINGDHSRGRSVIVLNTRYSAAQEEPFMPAYQASIDAPANA